MIYSFDDFEIDLDKFEIRLNGKARSVEPLVFDFLYFLVRNPNRIVSRDELIKAVWNGRIVSDATISSCIKSSRKILGDSGDHQIYIKTVRGRGIEFLANVSSKASRSDVTAQKSPTVRLSYLRYAVITGLLLIAIILFINRNPDNMNGEDDVDPLQSSYKIAVLPFADMSAEGNQEYFANGITEEILNLLATMDGLVVTSRTSAFSLAMQNLSVPEIADILDVNYIVEGSVRSSGNQVRVTAQLIEVDTDTHMWSNTYDRELDDIFAIQDEISAAVANSLRPRLVEQGFHRDIPTHNMEAYTLYLQGHQLFLDRSRDNIITAIEYLEKAIQIDPEFAEAWADLAANYTIVNSYGSIMDDDVANDNAANAANKAVDLKPELAQGWAIKGYLDLKDLKWADARDALERATSLNANNETAWMWLGSSYTSTGFFNKANNAYNKALEATPRSALNHGNLGRNYLMLGNYEKAKNSIETSLATGWWPASIESAAVAIVENDRKKVIEEYGHVLSRFGQSADQNLVIYVDAYFDASLKEEATTLLQMDMKKGGFQAIFGALLLLDGEAFITYVKQNDIDVITVMAHLFRPPFRALLNQTPVQTYMREIGLVDYWQDNGWPNICQPTKAEDNDFICS